jgi:hypothetical protein
LWSPNIPDLNPVDYKIGAAAEARVQESNTRLGRAEAALGGGLQG